MVQESPRAIHDAICEDCVIRYFLKNNDWNLARATEGASGYDLRADLSSERDILSGERWLVSTGLFLEMPIGVEAQVRSRSGLAINHGVIVLNAPGTVDSDYRGEVKVSLINLGTTTYKILPGDRIAQLVFAAVFPNCADLGIRQWAGNFDACEPESWEPVRVPEFDYLVPTDRGSGGHGSTGR
jgi:dUTP pyrophosphatase